MDDVDLDKPLALESLSTEFSPLEVKMNDATTTQREHRKKRGNTDISPDEFEPFDADTYNY